MQLSLWSDTLHATLIQWSQNVQKIVIRIAEPLAIIDQYDSFVSCLIMMTIAVLYNKIEYGRIDEVK